MIFFSFSCWIIVTLSPAISSESKRRVKVKVKRKKNNLTTSPASQKPGLGFVRGTNENVPSELQLRIAPGTIALCCKKQGVHKYDGTYHLAGIM